MPATTTAAEEKLNASAAGRSVLARYLNSYRLAAYVLVFYALGHTLGAVVATPQFGAESDSVVSMMKSVRVLAQGSEATWYGFYRGFGWFVTVFFVFSIVLAWFVGGKSGEFRAQLAPVTWSLFVSYVAGAVIAWIYFFMMPILFAIAVAALFGIGCIGDWFGQWRNQASGVVIRKSHRSGGA
jgi:hypothetical protein